MFVFEYCYLGCRHAGDPLLSSSSSISSASSPFFFFFVIIFSSLLLLLLFLLLFLFLQYFVRWPIEIVDLLTLRTAITREMGP